MDQLMPRPGRVGRLSETVTPVAVPVPSLVILIVKPTGLPAGTVWASGILIVLTSGSCGMQMPAWAVAEPALELVTLTVLSRLVAYVVTVITQFAMVVLPVGAVDGLDRWIVTV